jgi:hypothetical protein
MGPQAMMSSGASASGAGQLLVETTRERTLEVMMGGMTAGRTRSIRMGKSCLSTRRVWAR